MSGYVIAQIDLKSKEGYKDMVYCKYKTLITKRLENAGASAIMPLAAPIGSGLGLSLIHI